MNIYKLRPINQDATDWQASRHKSEVIVQANNELRARSIAQCNFGIAAVQQPGKFPLLMPWFQEDLVTSELIGTNNDLNEEILAPSKDLCYELNY